MWRELWRRITLAGCFVLLVGCIVYLALKGELRALGVTEKE